MIFVISLDPVQGGYKLIYRMLVLIWIQIAFEKVNFQEKSVGAQWLSGRELDSRPRGRRFEPHRLHCVVVLEQDTFILA